MRDQLPRPASTTEWRRAATRYGLAAFFTLLALALLEAAPFLQITPFVVMLAAVAFSAEYAGFGPALFSAALSILLTDFLFLEPRFSFVPVSAQEVVRICEFLFVALLVAQLGKKRSHAEQTVRDMSQRLAAIVQGAEDAILSKDMNGVITSWNAAAERLYGYTPQEAIGRHVSMLAPPEKATEIDDIMARLRRGEQVGHLQTEHIRKDGTRLTVWNSVSPVRDRYGTVVGASALTHDVTAQIQAQGKLQGTERELAAAYERLRLAQQAARIGTWEWNIASGSVIWSPELERIHGFAPDTFGGRFEDWLETIHPEDRDLVRKQLADTVERGRPYEIEYCSLRPDGAIFWTTSRGKVIYDCEGRAQRLVGVSMDIDDRKRAEQNMRQSEKLAATGRLAASIAHEINNPLEAVMNLVYLARIDPSTSPASRQYLTLADKELGRVAHLAKQTLGFYRDSSFPVQLSVAVVCDEVLDLYARRLESKEIVVEKTYVPDSAIKAFEGEIRQLFSNLIANALDALPRRGTLRIRVSRAFDRRDGDRPGVRITVADSGGGIPHEVLNRIFEPFFTTKRDVGTGLGLWLSRSIVEKHAGYMRVRSSSAPGRSGTTFSVFLPHSFAEARSPAPSSKVNSAA